LRLFLSCFYPLLDFCNKRVGSPAHKLPPSTFPSFLMDLPLFPSPYPLVPVPPSLCTSSPIRPILFFSERSFVSQRPPPGLTLLSFRISIVYHGGPRTLLCFRKSSSSFLRSEIFFLLSSLVPSFLRHGTSFVAQKLPNFLFQAWYPLLPDEYKNESTRPFSVPPTLISPTCPPPAKFFPGFFQKGLDKRC